MVAGLGDRPRAIAAGVVLLLWPVNGTLSLTRVLIAFFIVEGGATILYAVDHRDQLSGRWGWMLVSGIIDIILAAIILTGLPGTASWALGLLVGINMVFGGAALIGDGDGGAAIRRRLKSTPTSLRAIAKAIQSAVMNWIASSRELVGSRPATSGRTPLAPRNGRRRVIPPPASPCGTQARSTLAAIVEIASTAIQEGQRQERRRCRAPAGSRRGSPPNSAIIDTATPELMKVRK